MEILSPTSRRHAGAIARNSLTAPVRAARLRLAASRKHQEFVKESATHWPRPGKGTIREADFSPRSAGGNDAGRVLDCWVLQHFSVGVGPSLVVGTSVRLPRMRHSSS